MPTQPTSALRHQRRFARLAGVTVAAVRRAWRQMDPRGRWEDQYASQVGPRVTALVAASQVAATREADGYVADVLTELAFAPAGEPEPEPVLVDSSLAGFDGGGLPIQTLLEQVVREAGQAYNGLVEDLTAEYESNLAAAQKALDDTAGVLEGYVETILADTMRAAEEAAMAQRPWVAGFVRMAEPGACSRCILLSGKFYLFNEGFLRHPRCRCTHVPAPDARTEAGRQQRRDMETLNSPERLFESLSPEEQDRIFTQAGAQAIRDGADIGKVVNARRGMSKSQAGRIQKVNVNGRDVYVTTTGTRGGRRGRTRPVRLMPEQILLEAGEDVEERIRLLRLHGFITG